MGISQETLKNLDYIKNNIISGFELVKNELFCIKFTPKEVVTNYSLKITVYGH